MIPATLLLLLALPASAALVFWACTAGLAYLYVGYPCLIWTLARLRSRPRIQRSSGEPFSIVVVAFNEAVNLQRKLDSLFASERQGEILEVIVASDGSTDDTAQVVGAYPDPRVRLLDFKEQRGKPAVLNDVVPQCRTEIVVLTDARQEFHPQALGALLANFADPAVGAVSGELVLRQQHDSSVAARGIGFYWTYEKFIRKQESRFRSVPGTTGACYAIRKALYRPIDRRTLLDDVVIPMQVIERGYRCTFEPGALAYDAPSNSPAQEAIRKRRTIAGCVQLIAHHPRWLLPGSNPIWLEFVSHKILRLASPALLCGAGVSNLMLAGQPFYRLALAAQFLLYASAAAGWILQRVGKRSRWFGPALMFLTLNVTTVVALWDAARGRCAVRWNRAT